MLRLLSLTCLAATAAALLPSSALKSPFCRVQRSRNIVAQQAHSQALPAGWNMGVAQDTGATYYCHEATGHCQWEPPQAEQANVQLPAGWVSAVAQDTGATYYCHEATGTCQWELPQPQEEQSHSSKADAGGAGHGTQAQNRNGARVLWRLNGSAFKNAMNEPSGVAGFTGVAGFVGADKSRDYELDFSELPYALRSGEQRVLGRWNMVEQALTVSRKQCVVDCSSGQATLTSVGKAPTLWRNRGGPWCTVPKGESLVLSEFDQVSLDCHDPEAAVFTLTCENDEPCQAASYGQQQGGYGQQQGGYGQQDQPQLLHPWEAVVDHQSGRVYYSNPQTGQAQWEPPLAK